jgi:transposase InsO family protein
MQVSRKKVHRLMKLANLVRPRSVRKHVIVKRILTVPERPDHLWQHDFQTYQEADSVIGHFFQEYNWNRPHSSLKYMTPKEFYAACGGIK